MPAAAAAASAAADGRRASRPRLHGAAMTASWGVGSEDASSDAALLEDLVA